MSARSSSKPIASRDIEATANSPSPQQGDATVADAPRPAIDPGLAAYHLLEKELLSYLDPQQVARVKRAFQLGEKAHEGQTRRSGEPYITHPLEVATILAEMRLDEETICAAILHDALEDTEMEREAIAGEFGEAVAELVDGVTKLDRLRFRDRQEAAAESFRKMLLAMARDLRVILIKLADRLHNMRTIGAMVPDSRRRIARETLEVYAPIAQRLGMNHIKAELQDLGFAALNPWRHAVLSKRISSQPVIRREAMAKVEAQIAQRLTQESLTPRVAGRVKTPFSIYSKMRTEHKSLDQVLDVFGFRVVVQNVMQCYHVLGAVHALYKPLDTRFRDFIAIPKANGYQSLHTVLFGPYGAPIEVQIRTEEMDLIAERGIAAHWVYKHAGDSPNSAQSRAHTWIANLLESQQYAGSSLEFLDNVKVDLFPDEVYLFTPKGDILALPRNSTALDFAFAVHTDVGNHAVAARVDGKLVPLRSKLGSGQRVEIVTATASTPKAEWLEFVVTSKARTAIRHYLKRLQHEDAVELGHRMLDRALGALEASLDRVPAERLEKFLEEHRFRRLEELLADIALGNRMPQQVAQQLTRQEGEPMPETSSIPSGEADLITISGSERGVLSFANCCLPIPGDDIMGYLSAGKGVVVHREECRNVLELRKSPERCVPMSWDREVSGDYHAALRVDVDNKPGVLAQVAAAIAEAESNIDHVEYRERDLRVAVLHFDIEVEGRRHLAKVMRRVRRLAVVHGVRRL